MILNLELRFSKDKFFLENRKIPKRIVKKNKICYLKGNKESIECKSRIYSLFSLFSFLKKYVVL